MVRQLEKTDSRNLAACAQHFRKVHSAGWLLVAFTSGWLRMQLDPSALDPCALHSRRQALLQFMRECHATVCVSQTVLMIGSNHLVPCQFAQAGQYQYAKETLLKMDDTRALISLYVEESKWDDAFLLLNAHPGAVPVQPAVC